LCVLLGTMGSISFAALGLSAEQAATGVPGDSLRVFDPFALRTILVSESPATAQDTTGPRLEALSSRAPIRIPYRPAVRSAFRPESGF
jgi:hypothetical protein